MNLLEDNFREIYCAVNFPSDNSPLSLTANLAGTRIYDARYGWGRLWRWIYSALECLTGCSYHRVKLKTAIEYSHSIFSQKISKIHCSLNVYKNYLHKSGKGYSTLEDDCFIIRNQLTQWDSSIKPFLKHLKKISINNHLFNQFRQILILSF